MITLIGLVLLFVAYVAFLIWQKLQQTSQGSRIDLPRAFAEIERDRVRIAKQIASFLTKLERDPIVALNLRFVEGQGVRSDPFEFKGNFVTGTIHQSIDPSRSDGDSGVWTPPEYREGSTTVVPVYGFGADWGLTLVFRVAHQDPDLRLRLDWFKKSDPASSSIYVVDPVNHQYLYPIASSMKGEVLARIPRTGLLVFQFPDSPTDRLQVHFTGVQFGRDHRRKTSFSLEYTSPDLPQAIEQVKARPTISQRLETELENELDKVRSGLTRQ